MSLLAVIIIVISAFMHATWNYYAKISNGGKAFVWLYQAIGAVLYAPIVIVFFFTQDLSLTWLEIGFMILSGVLHLSYSLILQKGYKEGDLSLVYPVARGMAPIIVSVFAVIIFNEHISKLGMVGIALIIISVFIISGGLKVFKSRKASISIIYGLLTSLAIASYTLFDKGALTVMMISPLLLHYGSIVLQLLILTPFMKDNWKQVRHDWMYYKKEAIGVGVLQPFAYILILITMTFTPVSYVAPVREISIVVGALLGTYLLKEGFGQRRLIASVIMFIGIAIIALS